MSNPRPKQKPFDINWTSNTYSGNGFSGLMKTTLKHWQNLCKRVLKVKTWKKDTLLLCNQTSCTQLSASSHRRRIQNSHRKVSNHSKLLLLLLNSIWGLISGWQQFGAWSTRAVAQQRPTSTWTEALLPILSSNPPNRREPWSDGIWGQRQQWGHHNLQAKGLL